MNPKGSNVDEYFWRYFGSTGVPDYDPVYEMVKYISVSFNYMPHNPDDYVFRNYNSSPLSYDAMNRWVHSWRADVPNMSSENRFRIKLHSSRKTFANLGVKSGLNLLEIATYGTWALPTAVTLYVQYDWQYAIRLTKKLFVIKHRPQYRSLCVDMSKVSFPRKGL